jgi:GTPase SAR1 family protein
MDVQKYAAKNIMKVLVGNKTDLKGASRKVNTRSAANLAEFEELLYLETSAKWDDNVEILVTELAEQLRENARNKSRMEPNNNCPNSGASGLLKMGFHKLRESFNHRDTAATTALLAQN